MASCNVCNHGTGTENNNKEVPNSNNNCRPSSQSKCTIEVAFDEDLELQLNRQINTELMSFYHYLTMFAHFDRNETALRGFSRFYLRQAYEEIEHALKIIRYMNKRGARVKFCNISPSDKQTWCSARDSLQTAMDIEQKETTHLMELHATAREKKDHHLTHYLVKEFMNTQLESMNDLGERAAHLAMVGEGAGLYLYDRQLLKAEKKRSPSK